MSKRSKRSKATNNGTAQVRPKSPPSHTSRWTGLQIGPGLTLLRTDEIYREFARFGVTRRGFNAFLKSIGVPRLHLPGAELVDAHTFNFAMRCISRIGSEDFYFPGHHARDKGAIPSGGTTSIDYEKSKNEWKRVLGEIVVARKAEWMDTSASINSELAKAIDRIGLALAEATTIEYSKSQADADLELHNLHPLAHPKEDTVAAEEDEETR